MTQAAKAQEPTMEEILASIRRIISDDDAKPPAAAPTPPPAPTPPRQAAPPPPAPVAPPLIAEPKALKQDGIDQMLAELDVRKEPTIIGPEPADVLDLTESMVAPAPPPAAEDTSFRTIDGEPDVIFRETEPEPEPPPPAAKAIPEPPRPAPPFAPERLLSNATTAAVDSAFNTLAHTVLVQNARTLEDLVREMLRPLLKSWLDDNLPGIVERMVKAEIERVSRGRG
jgi:cell pole-organizing protein PopZ